MTTKTEQTDPAIELFETRAIVDKQNREIEKLKAELSKVTVELETKTVELHTATTAYRLHDSVRDAGVFAGAVPEVSEKAAQAGTWEPDSKGVLRLKDPATNTLGQSINKWLEDFKETKGFYFEDYAEAKAASGNTSSNGKQDGTASVRIDGVTYTHDELLTIFSPKSMNLTIATQVEQQNPELAASLAKQTGNKIFANNPTPYRLRLGQ